MADFFWRLIVLPLEYLMEVLFRLLEHMNGGNSGLAVIGLSVGVSLVTLPLYDRAENLQKKERQKRDVIKDWEAHIRQNFSGDEKIMIRRELYRTYGISYTVGVNGILPLLLQIPFLWQLIISYPICNRLRARHFWES